jgi:tetratricopeptide (TPR) repeat protein
VAEGIEHFKEGRHAEAFQCLNKALSIDARNVEGLVARGALYANSGSFKKAVDDFETALKLNPSHANARKYMGETLVALGRSFEEENKIEEAKKAYQDCLAIIPHHEEAQHSLDYLKNKANSSGKPIVEPGELVLPGERIRKRRKKSAGTDRRALLAAYGLNKSLEGTSRSHSESKKDKRSSKKDRKKKSRKRRDSSDSSSDSSDSSSDSSDSSSASDSSSSSG